MSFDAKKSIEAVSGVVQSAQGGVDVGGSENGLDLYINSLNLASTILGSTPVGLGLGTAAAVATGVGAANSWSRGELKASDVLSVTGGALGVVATFAAVSGAPATLPAIALASTIAMASGPGFRDLVNNASEDLSEVIQNSLNNSSNSQSSSSKDSTSLISPISDHLRGNGDICYSEDLFRHVPFSFEVNEDPSKFLRSMSDLSIDPIGFSDAMRMSAEYAGQAMMLVEKQMQTLIDAMAAFAPPAMSQTVLPSSHQNTLGVTLAANLQ